jgi:aldose 1-epimerase
LIPFLTLSTPGSTLSIDPALGGALLGWRWKSHEILRPMPEESRQAGLVEHSASWPLVPWSNRIARGRFTWLGREYQLPTSAQDPHAIHGIGWRRAWQVVACEPNSPSAARAHLALAHAADASWPFSFRAEQHITLHQQEERATLELRLSVTNLDAIPMPAGLGAHPYFARHAGTELCFRAHSAWEHDEQRLPTRLAPTPPELDFTQARRIHHAPFDRAFVGWDRPALLIDRERGYQVRIEADPLFSRLIVYVPPDEDYLAIEPVSHDTDAINRATSTARIRTGANHAGQQEGKPCGSIQSRSEKQASDEQADFAGGGLRVLAPFQTLSGSMRFTCVASGS